MVFRGCPTVAHNVSGIADGGVYLHNSPSEAQKFNVVQLLISGTSAPTFGNTLLAAGVFLNNKFMYGEKIQEKDYDMPTSVHQPELNVIIERLQSAVNRYDDIVCETRTKLQTIKKYEEPSTLNEAVKGKQPESATEEINCLLFRLNDLNEMAEINLRHLREIV